MLKRHCINASILMLAFIANACQTHEKPKETVVEIHSTGESLIDHEFSLKYKNLVASFDTLPLFVLPKQEIDFEILFPFRGDTFKFHDGDEWRELKDATAVRWKAPDSPGQITLEFASQKTKHRVKVNAFIMVPAEEVQNGKIDRYTIGSYPDTKNKRYIVPDGFIEITKENKDAQLSPSFRLSEFPSKQSPNYPKYLYLRESLILKLESIKRELIRSNIPVDKLIIMSGYRTPYYNKKIGNVKLSRHVFGDAADIFIDNDSNYRMDDLNGDGKSDIKDAEILADKLEELSSKEWYKPFVGGIGIYGPKPHRGPFVHVDTRGIRARWVKP